MKIPLLSLGFRPFFLLASLFGLLFIALWGLTYSGVPLLPEHTNPTLWHSHEMIFGFTGAVLMGFLLTASQNWADIPGIHGKKLLLLIILWLLGRVFFLLPNLHFLELLTLPLLIYFLLPYMWPGPKTRNRKVLFLLGGLWVADILFHLGWTSEGTQLGVDIIVGFLLLIAGRVIPFFRSKVFKTKPIQNLGFIEVSSSLVFIVFALTTFLPTQHGRSLAAFLLFALHLGRWWRWRPLKSLTPPILGILYLGYLWIILGFLGAALQLFVSLPASLVLHLFTLGGIGVFAAAMMTRVSLGHTGRPIRAGTNTLLIYVLMNLAVATRVFFPWLWPGSYALWIQISALLWCLSLTFFLFGYFPILTRPRPNMN